MILEGISTACRAARCANHRNNNPWKQPSFSHCRQTDRLSYVGTLK